MEGAVALVLTMATGSECDRACNEQPLQAAGEFIAVVFHIEFDEAISDHDAEIFRRMHAEARLHLPEQAIVTTECRADADGCIKCESVKKGKIDIRSEHEVEMNPTMDCQPLASGLLSVPADALKSLIDINIARTDHRAETKANAFAAIAVVFLFRVAERPMHRDAQFAVDGGHFKRSTIAIAFVERHITEDRSAFEGAVRVCGERKSAKVNIEKIVLANVQLSVERWFYAAKVKVILEIQHLSIGLAQPRFTTETGQPHAGSQADFQLVGCIVRGPSIVAVRGFRSDQCDDADDDADPGRMCSACPTHTAQRIVRTKLRRPTAWARSTAERIFMDSASADNSIPLAPGVTIAPADVRVSFSRSGGPGGQAVNKLSTKAELRVHLVAIQGLSDAAMVRLRRLAGQRLTQEDELVIHADTNRSQRRNREEAMDRFRELVLRAATPPKRRKKTKPSKGAIERRLQAKREHSEKKQRRKPL